MLEIKNINSLEKFELHYYFNDESHRMDAYVRHKCENEILYILKEIANTFEIELNVETEAYQEGGLKEVWTFVTKNKFLLGILTVVIGNILSDYATKDYDLIDLQKQNYSLSIEERKLNIEKLKNDLKKESNPEMVSKETTAILKDNYKILKHRSNFYENVSTYKKVVSISTNALKNDLSADRLPIVIERNDFDKFILHSDELPTLIDEDANIEIISPVLKKGRFNWRGIYKKEKIDFFMKDSDFKESVINQEITFQNGSNIDCVLELHRKLDEYGEIHIFHYTVLVVLVYRDNKHTIKTKQGKQYLAQKQMAKDQFKLF